jgi:gliding motility-associated-like protein
MKRIKLLFLLICSLFITKNVFSQLILGPDTLCVGNELQLSTTVTNASSYYWGFCSAYLNNIPTGSSIAAGTGLNSPSSIAMGKDGNNYFVFVVNSNSPRNVIRYDFGTNLSNVPIANNLGDFAASIPVNSKGFELVNTGGNWYGFLAGGSTASNSDLVRFDFGNSLSNVPTLVDLGNIGGLLLNPQDLFVFNEAGNWYAFTNNGFTGNLIRLEFGPSITSVPTLVNLGNPGSLAFPTGMWPVFDGTNWHLFVINRLSQRLSRLDFGTSLLNPVVDNDLGNPGGLLNGPRDISIIRDCGNFYGYITNETGNSMTGLTFNASISAIPTASDLGNFAGFSAPRYLTRFLRDRDNVFSWTSNNTSNSISRLEFNSCSASSPSTSSLQTPPPVTYSAPGLYNVYFASDEGLPTMQVDCKLIQVLPKPIIEINNDTLICQGDTILLVANGPGLYSNLWDPVYNAVAPYDTTSMFVYPKEDYRYNVHLEFTASGGCAYDTSVLVRVSRITADAGPDRFVADGAYTVLGGPRNSMGTEFSYLWTPATFLDNVISPTPTCTPTDIQFYVLKVTNDTTGCVRTDTVIVKTECTDIHLPNAFNPSSDIAGNRNFGLLNANISKLEFFKIFNRWGQLVFETTDPNKKWDGTYKNIELQPDNYVWIIDGYCNNGKRIKKQGTVLLSK